MSSIDRIKTEVPGKSDVLLITLGAEWIDFEHSRGGKLLGALSCKAEPDLPQAVALVVHQIRRGKMLADLEQGEVAAYLGVKGLSE